MQEEEYIRDIQEEKPGLKSKLASFLESRYFIAVCLVLVAIIAFCLGFISALQGSKEPVRVLSSGEVKGVSTDKPSNGGGDAQPSPEATAGTVVASKSGTKYHYPWCAGAKQISEKNKIYFPSSEAARAAGYTPASNCKGLK